MPKYGQDLFGGNRYGSYTCQINNRKKTIQNVELGFSVRRSLRKEVTFRVRPGNGYYGAIAGVRYQDKYKYFVPSSINNAAGQPARVAFAQAVYAWKNSLTNEEKSEYNRRAGIKRHLSGYNLFIREYVKANT
jgi:hypothetical protein